MKFKWTWLSILFILLMLPSQTLYAKENLKAQILGTKNLKISFPEDAYVLGQRVEDNDPYIALTRANKDQVEEYYKENNIFLHAISKDQSYEIICKIIDKDKQQFLTDLTLISEQELAKLANTLSDTYRDYGYTIEGSSVYINALNEKFAVVDFISKDADNEVKCRLYYSLLEDKAYYFTLRVFDTTDINKIEESVKQIIDSIYFFRLLRADSTAYDDEDYGIFFEVPAGWEEKEHDLSHKYLQTQYVHDSMLGETFQFYAYDVWTDQDIVRKIITTREEIDTTLNEELGESEKYLRSFFSDFSKVEKKDYKNISLLWEEKPMLLEHNDVSGDYYQQNYCMLRQGILYVFQYGYYEGSNLHEQEIEDLLNSVVLSEPEILENDVEVYEDISNFTLKVAVVLIVLLVGLVVAAIMYFKSRGTTEEE